MAPALAAVAPRALAALLAAVAAAGRTSALRSGRTQQGQQAAALVPPSLLLVSSPSERKVSYFQLADGAALHGAPRLLIGTGLEGPRGLAYDASSGKLYVADPPGRRVHSYELQARRCTASNCQLDYELVVGGSHIVVAEDVVSSWVWVDGDGSLYFTDQVAKTVNRISRTVLDRLASKALQSSDLKTVSELELHALTGAVSAAVTDVARRRARAALDRELRAAIVALHEAEGGANIGTPGGVLSEGPVVYWTNQVEGLTKGSLAAGSSDVEESAGAHKTLAVSSITDAAYGVASTFSKILFAGDRCLYSVSKASRATSVVSEAVTSPRGMVWDGDSTVYVADMGGDAIYSLASGRDGPNQPLQEVAGFPKPFGLALLRPADLPRLLDAAAAVDAAAGAASSWWPSWLR